LQRAWFEFFWKTKNGGKTVHQPELTEQYLRQAEDFSCAKFGAQSRMKAENKSVKSSRCTLTSYPVHLHFPIHAIIFSLTIFPLLPLLL
jgi:hypothetical protein